MEKRRTAKITNFKEYRRLNNQLRRETDRAKEVYMKELCKETMDLQKCANKRWLLYKEIKMRIAIAKDIEKCHS